jgi:DNA-binding GntR family transcriptional regulator
LLESLRDAVLLARLAPGQRVTLREFAGMARADERQLAVVLPELEASGLIAVAAGHVTARPLDSNAMFATLPRRMELEIRIVRSAALGASEEALGRMQASEAVQRRCAMVGDMDGLMRAERELERLLVEASGLHEDGAELVRIKREFRRAWCAANRLRDFTNVASIRTALVAAIAARDVEAAEAQVRVFFDHLVRSY